MRQLTIVRLVRENEALRKQIRELQAEIAALTLHVPWYKKVMKWLGLFLIVALCSSAASSSEIYYTKIKSDADLIVYVTNSKSEADNVIWFTNYPHEAKKFQYWYVRDYPSSKTLRVFVTKIKSEAQMVVYFTKNKWESK